MAIIHLPIQFNHTLLFYSFLLFINNSYSQEKNTLCFDFFNDTTKNFTKFCIEEKDTSSANQFYKKYELIPLEQAMHCIKNYSTIDAIKLEKAQDSENFIWVFTCNYKVTSPRKYEGFAFLIKYKRIIVDASTGTCISTKKIKILSKY